MTFCAKVKKKKLNKNFLIQVFFEKIEYEYLSNKNLKLIFFSYCFGLYIIIIDYYPIYLFHKYLLQINRFR